MRGGEGEPAGLTGLDRMVWVVENFPLAACGGEAIGQEQFRGLRIMIRLAQHRDWIALGLAVKLREHRADPLDALDQPARRHRGRAVKQQLERGEIGPVERRMVQQHVDHGWYQQREIDALALDGLEYRLRIESRQHVYGASEHKRGPAPWCRRHG